MTKADVNLNYHPYILFNSITIKKPNEVIAFIFYP